jgi:predicted glycosyltransferase
MTVAAELTRRWPEAAFLLLSSSMTAHAHELPPNVDYVRLPTVAKEDLYQDLPLTGTTPGRLKGFYRLREALVLEAIDGFAPDLVWVDDSPSGIGGDLVRALACLHAANPPVALAFGTKDISDHAHVVQRNWGRDGSYHVLDNVYDRILIYSDPRFYDSLQGFSFGPAAVAKTRYCGFLAREDPLEPAARVRARLGVAPDQPLLVVTAGGGADGGELTHAVLAALREPALAGAAAFIATGPLLADDEQTRLAQLAASLPNVTLTPFTTQLHSYLNAADLVITMGGLTVYEVLKLGTRLLIVPRVRWWAEQLLRAERLVELGLASMLLPSELSSAAVARVTSAMLAEPPPRADLDFDGVRRVGDELVALLAQVRQRQPAVRNA